jgi:hypothetical protein
MFEPVTERFETVGFAPLQKVWVANPVGADGVVFTFVVTVNRASDSHPFTVWLA